LVNGAALCLFAITSGVVGIMARGLRPRPAMLLGAIASVASMGLLALSVAWQGLSIFLASTAIAGIGYSLLVLGGLALIGGAVPENQRGGVLSALYLFAYLSMGIVALGLGVVATERRLGLAVDLGAAAITLLSLGTIGLLAIQRMQMLTRIGPRASGAALTSTPVKGSMAQSGASECPLFGRYQGQRGHCASRPN
jgi:hypothetical protein